MAYKDDYYAEVDTILDGMRRDNPYELGNDINAVRQEDQGQIQPVGWVENADATDGEAKVTINADGITVIEGKITVQDAGGSTIMDAGEVRIVENSTSEVIINASGISITNGAITVTNASATVIIDGTSNMFKIQATGTMSHAVNDNVVHDVTTVTLTGLGALATTPAHLSMIGSTNTSSGRWSNGFAQSDSIRYVAPTNSAAATDSRVVATTNMRMATYLDGSSQCVVESRRSQGFATHGLNTWYGRYYVLKEAAL